MSKKKTNILWAISLILIGIAAIMLAGIKFMNLYLPDILIRILGFADIIGLSLLFFSTAKKLQYKA